VGHQLANRHETLSFVNFFAQLFPFCSNSYRYQQILQNLPPPPPRSPTETLTSTPPDCRHTIAPSLHTKPPPRQTDLPCSPPPPPFPLPSPPLTSNPQETPARAYSPWAGSSISLLGPALLLNTAPCFPSGWITLLGSALLLAPWAAAGGTSGAVWSPVGDFCSGIASPVCPPPIGKIDAFGEACLASLLFFCPISGR